MFFKDYNITLVNVKAPEVTYNALESAFFSFFLYIFQYPLSSIMWNFSAPVQE